MYLCLCLHVLKYLLVLVLCLVHLVYMVVVRWDWGGGGLKGLCSDVGVEPK